MLTKYASIEEILEVKTAHERLPMDFQADGENLAKFAKAQTAGDIENGYLYVRARAISSRVNKNNDGWPSEELSRAYKTFVGRPVFVDHNNQDPKRTRGVIVDSKLHVEEEKTAALDPYYASAPDNHKPPTWIEILIEVDAETYPKLAKSIQAGDIDAVSMGANIDRSICSVCANEASVPAQYCDHISSGKGAEFQIVADSGETMMKKAYEDCLTPETPILMSDGRWLPVSEIKPDDLVIDHLGLPRKVLKSYARSKSGYIYNLHRMGQGYDDPLRVTANHPILAIRWDRKREHLEKALEEGSVRPEFVLAKDLTPGDWIVEVTPRHDELTTGIAIAKSGTHKQLKPLPRQIDLDEQFGRWCGWYLAEGSLKYQRGRKRLSGICFGLHANERDAQEEILTLGRALFGIDGKIEYPKSGNGISVLFHSRALAELMQQLGESSKTKALPESWLNAPISFIRGVVTAHAEGDGHIDPTGLRPSELSHSTASPILANQLYQMHLWLGHTPSKRLDKKSILNKRTIDQNIIYCTPEDGVRSPRGRLSYGPWKFARLSRTELEPYEGKVHNLHVEDTHTYIAKGQAVHNCYGVNFFEISFVFDPADPTADAWLHDGEEAKIAKEAADNSCPHENISVDDEGNVQCNDCGETLYVPDGDREAAAYWLKRIRDQHFSSLQKEAPGKKHVEEWSAKRNRQYEHILDSCKEEHPDWSEERCKELAARTVNKTRSEKGETKGSSVYSHLIKQADEDRTLNYEPQSEQVTAPQKVDTLRDDVRCPNCESDDLGTDPDGILRCPTCGYEQPPEGLDNPDLSRAKDFDQVQEENEQRDQEGNRETPVRAEETDALAEQQFIAPVQPIGATKADVTTEGINEMIWKRKVKTNDAAEARAFLASKKTAASAEITPGGPQGIHNGTHGAFRQMGLTARVHYPESIMATVPPPILGMIHDNVSEIPGNPMKDMFLGQHAVTTLGLASKADIPLLVESDRLDEAIQVIQQQAGAQVTGATKNGPVTKKVVLPGGERQGDEPKDEKVISDQLSPVTADRRVIKREEHPDGRRTEQIVEETGELGISDEPKEEPKAEKKEEPEEKKDEGTENNDNVPDFLKKKKEEEKVPVAASAKDGEKKLLAAFQVAEDAVELGIIAKEHKMAFVAQLEGETLEQIETRRNTLAMVKSAGLVKRTLSPALSKRLPKIASAPQSNNNGGVDLDDIPIEAVFWNG